MHILENFHFKELFEVLPDGVVIIDAQTQLPVTYNHAAYEMLEYEKDEFAKLKISDYEALENHEEIQKHIENISRNGRDDFETKHKTKHGKSLDVRVTAITHKIKEKTYLLCTFRNITEQKNIESISRKREEQFKVIFEKANCGIAYGDENGSLILCNRYFANMVQYSHNELVQMNFSKLTHPEDLNIELPLFKEIVNQERDDYRLKKRYIRKDGKIIWVDLAVSVIRDENGNPTNYLGAVIDITKEKLLEEEIAKKEKRFRDVAEASGEYIWEMDANGAYTFLTKPFEDMLGYTPDEGLGNTPFSFMPQDEEKRVGEYFLNEVAAKGISFRGLTHKSLTKDGKIVWQKVNGLPMLDKNGKVVGYRGAARDITAEKLAQEELEAAIIKAKTASNAKSQFLANMSHEIRTPMNAIIGLGDMLAQTTNEPKTKDIIDKINSSSKMLLGIINDILDYSKIEAGKLELEKNSFQIEEIFTQLKVMLETKASQKGLEFYFHPKGKDPGVIIGDKLRLTQVLTNLLSNAIKFTNEGNITLTVEFLEKTKENKAKILFNVKDSGIGISKENINRLFKPFSQADNSTTRKYGGTGLGLAISKNIINAMGSDISVQTKEGVGSKFSFVLDFELASHQIDKKGQQELQANVLIVDDQEISRKVLGDILKELDCKFDEAQDGIEAIELIKKADKSKEPYNILLIDWNMPRLNGTQTLRRLQKMYKTKELKNKIPTVFMVSGYSMDEIDFEDIQIERFISKPITPNTLLDALLDTQEGLDKKYLAPKASNTPKIDSLHLLIAEDNELNQEVVSLMLQAVGISFEIANNGKECVEIFAKNQDKFDLILMDLQMPIMGGYEATQKIREFNQKIPIIALTAAAMSEDRDKAIETGMNEHISKPIDKNKLYSIISKYANAKNPKKTQKNQSNKTLNLEYLIDIVGSRERAISLMLKLKEQLSTGEFKNIIHMLKTKDPATQSQIHSLKGVCGNLGLFGIHEILKSIDSQFKNNESISQQSINQLEIALKELLEQLDNLQMQNIAKKENQKISQDELSNLTKRAKQLLFSGEIIEEDMLYTLYENLPIYIQKDELERWKELVEDFEFDEAFKIMEKWDLTKPL